MTKDTDIRPQDPVNNILYLIGTPHFQKEMNMPGSQTIMGVEKIIKKLSETDRGRVATGIINDGIAQTSKDQQGAPRSQSWTATANKILSQVVEAGIAPQSCESISSAYINALVEESKRSDPSLSVNLLLSTGKRIAPYIGAAHAVNDSWPGDIIYTWNSLGEKFASSSDKDSIAPQTEQIRIALGLTYLEQQYYRTYTDAGIFVGPMFAYCVKYPDASISDLAGRVAQQTVDEDGLRTKQRQLLLIYPPESLNGLIEVNTKKMGRMTSFLTSRGLLPPQETAKGTIYRRT